MMQMFVAHIGEGDIIKFMDTYRVVAKPDAKCGDTFLF
jgi:hypothetical protein